jgi:hypothetical protein
MQSLNDAINAARGEEIGDRISSGEAGMAAMDRMSGIELSKDVAQEAINQAKNRAAQAQMGRAARLGEFADASTLRERALALVQRKGLGHLAL